MQDTVKISAKQSVLLILMGHLPTAVLFVPGHVVTLVAQDAWISVIIGAVLSIVLGYLPMADLARRYPQQTILQYSDKILGKYLGKLIGFICLYNLFILHCWTLREFGELMLIFSPKTPMLVSVIIFSMVTAYAVYYGLENIARCSEFLIPIGMFSLLLIGLSNIANMDLSRLVPVMESGIRPLVGASIVPIGWYASAILGFGFFGPNVNNQKHLIKIGIVAIASGGIFLTLFSIMNIAIFGPEFLKTSNFALLELAKLGSITVYFQRLEPFLVILWICWIFIRAAFFSYVSTASIAQFFKLADYRYFIIPETILAVAYSNYMYRSFMELSYLFASSALYYLFAILGIPLLLWSVALIRGKVKKSQST